MSKIAIIYWSGTGNTESMAISIGSGIKKSGSDVEMFTVSEFDSSRIDEYTKIAFGCPSMGSEVLEEYEFEPFFAGIEGRLSGKNIALFGSYGWGEGQWMLEWQDRVQNCGAKLFLEGLIINEAPNDEGKELCVTFGEQFAAL